MRIDELEGHLVHTVANHERFAVEHLPRFRRQQRDRFGHPVVGVPCLSQIEIVRRPSHRPIAVLGPAADLQLVVAFDDIDNADGHGIEDRVCAGIRNDFTPFGKTDDDVVDEEPFVKVILAALEFVISFAPWEWIGNESNIAELSLRIGQHAGCRVTDHVNQIAVKFHGREQSGQVGRAAERELAGSRVEQHDSPVENDSAWRLERDACRNIDIVHNRSRSHQPQRHDQSRTIVSGLRGVIQLSHKRALGIHGVDNGLCRGGRRIQIDRQPAGRRVEADKRLIAAGPLLYQHDLDVVVLWSRCGG